MLMQGLYTYTAACGQHLSLCHFGLLAHIANCTLPTALEAGLPGPLAIAPDDVVAKYMRMWQLMQCC